MHQVPMHQVPMHQVPAPSGKVLLRRIFIRTLLGLLAATAVAWVCDYGVFRLRVAMNWNAYGTVTVDHYTAVAQKNGKTQFIVDPPASQSCANSLFSHAALQPCWYLRKHPEERTDI